MTQKKHTTEEIIRILRDADGGRAVEEVLREQNVSAATFCRWRRKFGGMDVQHSRRYRELDRENSELKKMLADSMLKIRVLEEVNSKEWRGPRTRFGRSGATGNISLQGEGTSNALVAWSQRRALRHLAPGLRGRPLRASRPRLPDRFLLPPAKRCLARSWISAGATSRRGRT